MMRGLPILSSLAIYIVALIIAVLILYPVVVLLLEGFDIDLSPIFAPGLRLIGGVPYYSGGITPSLEYYIDLLQTQNFPRLILNSLTIGIVSSLIALFVGLLSSFAFRAYRIRGEGIMEYLILVLRAIPPFAVVIPLLILYSGAGLWDTHIGMSIIYLVINIPTAFWVIRSFIDSIPREIFEAAILFGASRKDLLTRIVIPLIIPGLIVTLVFSIVLTWNEFLYASILTGPYARTVAVGVWAGVGEQIGTLRTPEFEAQAAAGTLAFIPVFIAILMVRRYLTRMVSLAAIR